MGVDPEESWKEKKEDKREDRREGHGLGRKKQGEKRKIREWGGRREVGAQKVLNRTEGPWKYTREERSFAGVGES